MRLYMEDLLDCSGLSALNSIVLSSNECPDLEEWKFEGPRWLASQLMSGPCSLETEAACNHMYLASHKQQSNEAGVWSVEGWVELKEQLEFIANKLEFFPTDVELSKQTRALAASLKLNMEEAEQRAAAATKENTE
ncbi:hypothetical protein VHEMI10153 [[Torrubiella] hemipterigena]|uniref:Uncharacterized protein n=1 Tax=[Torrubiella] hemipterigena TaxID=1531966 RepID=A0A0A1TI27_9HYPO|nr:hypothetical protein VHEMI10153 [[Torrubiella] hemipterigena]